MVMGKELEKGLEEVRIQLREDTIKTSMVANDMLCWMQETGMALEVPAKDDAEGMAKWLQSFFDFMAFKMQARHEDSLDVKSI